MSYDPNTGISRARRRIQISEELHDVPPEWVALKLDHDLPPTAGEYTRISPANRAGRAAKLRRIVREECADRGWRLVERAEPPIDPLVLAKRYEVNSVTFVRFIEPERSPWLIIAAWPFGYELSQRCSYILNTISIHVNARCAYEENWEAVISIAGRSALTLLRNEHMEFLGIQEHHRGRFRGDAAAMSAIFEIPENEAREAVAEALASGDEEGSAADACGRLLTRLKVWPENWDDYFTPHGVKDAWVIINKPGDK